MFIIYFVGSTFTDDSSSVTSSSRVSPQLTDRKPWQPATQVPPISLVSTVVPPTEDIQAPKIVSPPIKDPTEQVPYMPPAAVPQTHSAGLQIQSPSLQAPQTSSRKPESPKEHHKPHSFGDMPTSSAEAATSRDQSSTVAKSESRRHVKSEDDGPIDTVIFTSIDTKTASTRIPGSVSVDVHKHNPKITEPSTMVDYIQSDSEVSSYRTSPRETILPQSDSWPRSHQPISPSTRPRQHKQEEVLVVQSPLLHGNHAGKSDDVVSTVNSQDVKMSTSAPVNFSVSQMLEQETKPVSVEREHEFTLSSNQITSNHSLPGESICISGNQNMSVEESSVDKLTGLDKDSKMDSGETTKSELLIDFSVVPSIDMTSKDSPVDLLNDVTNDNDLFTLTPDVIVSSQALHDHMGKASSPVHTSSNVSLHTEKNSAINELQCGIGDNLLDFTEQQNLQSSIPIIPMVSSSQQAGQSDDGQSFAHKDVVMDTNISCDPSDKISMKSAKNVEEFSVQYDAISKTHSSTTISELRKTTLESNKESHENANFDRDLSSKSPKTDENFNQTDVIGKNHEKVIQESTITVINSKRKWCILTSDDVIKWENTPLKVSMLRDSLIAVISPTKIASVLDHTNSVLDSTNVPISDEIVIIVLQDGNDLWEEVKFTEDSRGKIMVSNNLRSHFRWIC